MDKLKCSVITSFIGQTKDRFRFYNDDITIEEKLDMVVKMEDIDGVEVVHPYEVPAADKMKKLLKERKLNVAAVNVNIKSEPEFIHGTVTSSDPAVKAKAIQFIKNAKDYAQDIGADKVQCCPLGDGYEFSFQHHYGKAWKSMIDFFAEAGDYKPEIPLFVEYKPSEVRGRCTLSTASKAVYMLEQIGNPNMGITLDFGHSMYGDENPAEALCLLAESKFPYYIHINDNDKKWDWDYMVGSHNFLTYVEFLYYLNEYKYDDYITSDTSPQRQDIMKTFEANARWSNKIWNIIKNLDKDQMNKLMSKDDYMDMWKFIEENIFFRR